MMDKNSKPTHEDQERFQAIISQMTVGISQTDLEGRLMMVNDRLCEIVGYAREELLEKKMQDITHPEDLPRNLELFRRLVEENESFVIEKRYIRKDGQIVWGETSVSGIRDKKNNLRYVLAVVTDITERKETQESLKQSEERYRAFVTQSSEAIWRFELKEPFSVELPVDEQIEQFYKHAFLAECNDATANMYGYASATEIVGASLGDFVPPDDENNIAYLQAFIASGYSLTDAESHELDREGHAKFFLNNLVGVIEDGLLKRAWGTQRDITEQKRTIDAVRESKAMLSMSMKSSRMGAWARDVATNKISWTEELEEIFGLEKGDFLGTDEHFYSLIYEEDVAALQEEVRRAVAECRDYMVEFRFYHRDGSIRWMEGRGQGIYSKTGAPIRLYGIGMDITDRKEAEEALLKAERRASEEYLELLSRIVPVAQTLGTARELTSIYRAVHGFVRATMPCSAFFVSFYEPRENLRIAAYAWGEQGELDISVLPPIPLTENGGPNSQAVFQKRSIVFNRYMEKVKDHPHVLLQTDGIDPNSSLVVPMIFMNRIIGTLEVQAYENKVFTGEHVIALEMVANLAAAAIENVRLSQVEADARETAEAANRAKDQFLSVLSHELRTPLNSMLGWVRMIRAGMLNEEKTGQAIEIIERNTVLQNNLIEDLLDVSRIITGKLRIETEELDLVPVVETAVETVRPLAEAKKIFFDFQSDVLSVKINGDPTRLQQIVINLANNAVKFTPEEGTVIIRLTVENDTANLEVIDTGVGINPEFLERIFDRFSQADSTTRRTHSGLGLGLTIVKHLAELHGGSVKAFSEGAGRGATFKLEMPVIPQTNLTNSKKDFEIFSSKTDSLLQNVRILMVDDDCEGIFPLKILLEQHSATVECADSAREALEILQAREVDLLISDIGMPEIDGFDFIKLIRKTDKHRFTPAIALTAYASTEDRYRTLNAGFQQHLPKPVDFDQLLQTIRNLLDRTDHGKN